MKPKVMANTWRIPTLSRNIGPINSNTKNCNDKVSVVAHPKGNTRKFW